MSLHELNVTLQKKNYKYCQQIFSQIIFQSSSRAFPPSNENYGGDKGSSLKIDVPSYSTPIKEICASWKSPNGTYFQMQMHSVNIFTLISVVFGVPVPEQWIRYHRTIQDRTFQGYIWKEGFSLHPQASSSYRFGSCYNNLILLNGVYSNNRM